MSDEVKLLPCPLCAGEARQCEGRGSWDRLDTRSRPNVHWIECYSCCCRSGERPSAKEAIAAWNTRAIEATRPTEQGLGAIPGSHPTDQAPSGLGASRFDPERIDALLRSLLQGEFTSLTIGFNDLHACNYQTAAQWSEEMGDPDGGMQTYNDLRDWASPEEREKALANNSVWSIQWYPNTPVGFCQMYASSLEALLVAIAREKP